MARFVNRKQLERATDEEIEQFFAETVFEGVFSHEVKSKNTDFYKGSISNIKLEGRPTKLVSIFLNVNKPSNPVPEGPCSFKCRMKIASFREDPPKYIVNLVGGSLQAIDNITKPVVAISAKDAQEQELFEMWGVNTCECIGFYHYDEENEIYLVDDLRKTNFDHIPYYPGDKEKRPIKISYPHEIRGIKPDNYYLFTWKLSHKNEFNPYEIFIDFKNQPKSIEPKWFINTLFDDRHNDKSKNFGSATNFLDTLSKQLSAKESTFVYELLQNANDYPVECKKVDVEFHITDNYLLFMHTGDKFNVRNISGICGINEKEKVANKRTIGYKGIGFKTVFLHNHYVYLQTGDYSFRFDEGETPEKKVGGKIKRLGAPFQILPIWTEHREVAKEVNNVFDASDKNFRVRIALRPEDKNILHVGKNSYKNLFKDIFADANIILFIPNINSVKVVINGREERLCLRDNEEWVVGDYEEEIPFELQEAINKTIDKGNSRIPEKYKDFDYTKVSFACKHEGAMIKPVDKAILYCYLPTKASWGFPFLMNTDMIPKGDRNDIETEVKLANEDESNFNGELAAIAGKKLFVWIKDLLTSNQYQLASVFSLVPDFKKCKKEHDFYDEFIEKFEETFNESVVNDQIVPVKQDIANVKHVIFDTTGLSTSGIMTDEEFCKFTEMEDYYLPLPMLRKDKNFNSFLKRYVDDDQKFTEDNLSDLISNNDFQEWLKDQDNNNRFLNFLLEKGYLKDHIQEDIFIEDEGNLYAAGDLFYDVDKYLVDLNAFTNHICYLSSKTREFFKDKKEWENIIDDAFADFDCEEFVNDTLLSDNYRETVQRLKDKDTSIHFFKFVAENVSFNEEYLSLPFIADNDETVDDFNDRFLFFTSRRGHDICESEWLSDIQFDFVSDDYLPVTKEYFKDNFDVRDYSDEIIIKDIILSDDYKDNVSGAINDDFDISYDFVQFCFSNSNLISDNGLSGYSLKVFDCNGDEQWYIVDGDSFFNSSNFEYYSAKEWIDLDWMASLDDAYFDDIASKDNLKKFFKRTFGVQDLTDKTFYHNVVSNKQNLKEIFKNISGTNDPDGSKNIDFIKYLDDNYELIFVEEKDADTFTDMKLVTSETSDVSLDSENLYIYDNDLTEIIEYEWFPEDIVSITHPDYGKSKALIALGVKTYKFSEFFDNVIAENIDSINDNTSSKEESISFHDFIIEHYNVLTQEQQIIMKNAKVYLYGQDEPADESCGHNTLSANAKELFNLGLVEFSDLNIIDPEYKTEEHTEYWETRLENSKFTVNHFFTWLGENIDTFSSTIENEDLNIAFWRWLKDNVSDKLIDEASELPVLLKDGSIDSEGPVYFSDEYMDGAAIEHSVKIFDKNAKFLSPKYIDEEDDAEDWKTFFSKADIKYEIIDILVETVIPQLSEIDDESLPKLIAENREALEKRYENGLISELTNLRVKAHDGEFYDISETIYIDCEKDEPFPYIELPNQISFDSAEVRRLIKEIIDEVDGDCIINLSDWQQRKLDCYLDMQENDTDDIRDFHYQFINDLAIIRKESIDSLKELERVEEIQILNRDDEFCVASDLTMGSIYKPYFDFELCGLELDYVSDSYKTECSENVGKMFRSLKVHFNFKEDDLEKLEDRKCAIYFWGTYLKKPEASTALVKSMITDHKFDNIACIPMIDYMKCASELYYGAEVSRYVKSIEDWENKVPLKDLPDIKLSDDTVLFSLLPFKESLDFLDALYAIISIKGQDRRTQLLEWMIDDYDESYDSKIDEYREDEHAEWCNNKNDNIQIKELYALDYWDKALDQFFGTNPRIVNKAYFPSGDSFKEACDILKIKTITSNDLQMEPVSAVEYTARTKTHKLFALVMAGLIDEEGWKNLYDDYCEKLEPVHFYRCKSILITYIEDSEINQSLKKFYYQRDTNSLYFVKSLDDKLVYESYVKQFLELLGIDEDDIAYDQAKIIMDDQDSALEIIKEQNTLMLDEDFKNKLDELIPGIKRELFGNEVIEEDEDSSNYRPSFTTQDTTNGEVDEDNDIDSDEEPNVHENVNDNNNEDDYPENLEAPNQDEDDFIQYRKEMIEYDGTTEEVVCEHYRSGTWVRGHMRNGYWVNGYWRDGSTVSEHSRTSSVEPSNNHYNIYTKSENTYSNDESDNDDTNNNDNPRYSDSSQSSRSSERKARPTQATKPTSGERHEYSDMTGWHDRNGEYTPQKPKPYFPEDVRNFGSHGVSRALEVLEPTTFEVDEINRILGEDLSSEQVADQNHLAQLRLYNNLIKKGYQPDESKDDFVRNAHLKNEHTLGGGKYIHKCSAAGGIMYLSPSIWNKIADDRCVVCVYLGAKANEFMYFNTLDDILEWIGEDDIVIKLTGEEKADVVEELYSGVLEGVKGTAYTMIRVMSNEKYNSVFAPLAQNDINDNDENEEDY